jgi:GTPase SAR1 family protein
VSLALLSVKVFDKNNVEIQSTVSVSSDKFVHALIPLIGELAREESHQNHVQALVRNNHLLTFYNTPEDFLLVAYATPNTSFRRLQKFLELLGEKIRVNITLNKFKPSDQNFQDICDSVAKSIDSTKELRISLLGLERSGKTTFANYFSEDSSLAVFNSYTPTNLLNIVNIHQIDNLPSMRLYDLGMAFQNQWWKFKGESDGYIFFISSDDSRMNEARDLLQEVRNFWDLPFVVAANKRDTARIVNLRKYISRKVRVPIKLVYETETSTGYGLIGLLEGLVKEIHSKKTIVNKLFHSRK